MDVIFDSDEASRYLKMSKVTLYRHVREGIIPSFKVGARWKFHKIYLDKWIDKRVQEETWKRSKRTLKSDDLILAENDQKNYKNDEVIKR